jgi:predicted component of type VI protein secretion system
MLVFGQMIILSLVFAVSHSFAASQIYTYRDDSGTPNFTTELDSIPEKYRSRVVPLDSDTSSPVEAAVPSLPPAAVRIVTASGEYRMGDHDTRADAVRLAIEAAKRQALEQVATYLESVTEVKNLDVTRDDIRTYTAGVVMVLNQEVTTRLEGETVVIHADLTAQVDPNEVAQAITALRENESAKNELVALRTEVDQLHQQLDATNQALATAVSPDQVQTLNQQRQDLLNQLQTNALISQAWTDWVYVRPIIYPYPWIGVQQVHGLLLQARQLHPQNRHLRVLQQTVTAQVGTVPTAPAPGLSPPLLPRVSLLVPPQTPQHLSPAPHQSQPQGSRFPIPGMHEVNPSTTPAPQHFSSPLPPTLEQVHPPHFAQPNPPVLRAPYSTRQMSPQYFGGGGGHAGRGGSFGGGHRGR